MYLVGVLFWERGIHIYVYKQYIRERERNLVSKIYVNDGTLMETFSLLIMD